MESGQLSEITVMLKNLVPNIEKITLEMSEVKSELRELKATQSNQIEVMSQTITSVSNELAEVKTLNTKLQFANRNLTDRVNRLEAYSRRNNLIFHNIPEDQAPLITTIHKVLTNMKVSDVQSIHIDDIHRLGPKPSTTRSRPIIVRLLARSDRHKIWEARRNLKGTKIILSEDFPEEYVCDRNILRPVVRAARANGLKATLVANKVKVDGRVYGVDQMKQLPDKCNPEQSCFKENGDTICFFGRYTPLSNFYPSTYNLAGTQYNCMEQFIQQRKAEVLGSDEIAHKIMNIENPEQQQKLGRSVPGDIAKWNRQARSEVLPALHEKFRQNPELKAYLLSTDNKILAEASTNKLWGTGMKLDNPLLFDKNQWQGDNILGNMLMTVRENLKSSS
jgi:ribA/ribD-fused uncharacterized protein